MPFVQGNCTNCGGTLAVDNEKEAWVCPYCNTPFIVEKAINNFNVTNNINANVVNIYGGPEKEFEIAGGNLKKYKGESTDVVIPDNVSTISYSAFHETNITSISLPEGIREVYLSSCKCLKNIKLPKSVVNFGLMNCTAIQSVELHEGLQFVYFEGCTSINNLKLPTTIKHIKKGTFHNCRSLTNLFLPDSIVSIEDDFSGCDSMEEIFLPANIRTIKLSSMKRLNRFTIPINCISVEINDLPLLEKIALKNTNSIIKGLHGERLIYDGKGVDASVLYRTNYILPNDVGTIKLCFALSKKCTYCGGEINFFNSCKKCGKNAAYGINTGLCPKCLGNKFFIQKNSLYRKCLTCGYTCMHKDLVSRLVIKEQR